MAEYTVLEHPSTSVLNLSVFSSMKKKGANKDVYILKL